MSKNIKFMTKVELLKVIDYKNRALAKSRAALHSQKYYTSLLLNRLKKIRRQFDDVIEHPYSEGIYSQRKKKCEKKISVTEVEK